MYLPIKPYFKCAKHLTFHFFRSKKIETILMYKIYYYYITYLLIEVYKY